jgi:hypothetical protein
VLDFDQHAGWHFLKRPHYAHSLRERFQVMKANFNVVAIDDLFGSPGNRNAGARRGHYDNVPTRATYEITDIAIVGENPRPQLQVRGRLENHHLRRAHDDGVGFVHWK